MLDIVTDPVAFPRAFETALNTGDLERIVALYDEEAVLRVQSGDIHPGSAAVRAEMRQLIASKANIANTLRHTLRRGDTALIIVDYVLRLTAPNGSPVEMTGTTTNVIQRHAEKGWRRSSPIRKEQPERPEPKRRSAPRRDPAPARARSKP